MDRQWVLSSPEKLDQFFTRSSRADFSSFRQDSAVRPNIRPAAPAALQLGSTLRIGTLSAATVIRLEPRTKAAKGIMEVFPGVGRRVGSRTARNDNTVPRAEVARKRASAGDFQKQAGGLVRHGGHGKWFDAIL